MLQLPKPPQTQKSLVSLSESYELCRQITAEFAKTFYLGSLLLPKEKRLAIWAVYAWCRRTDELVDGASAQGTTLETLAQWEQQLELLFAGYPTDDLDVALSETIKQFAIDIQPFKDMIAGQRMDLSRNRYETFEELKLYCYRVAGTVGLITNPVWGLDSNYISSPWENPQQRYEPKEEAVSLGIAMQLTNILRDVGEDARRGRIYLPLEDLRAFNYTEEDLCKGIIDERWRALMQFQIQRARHYYNQAEKGISYLDARLPVWTALMLYQGILDAIERNHYDVFSKRAYVSTSDKLLSLPVAWLRAQAL
jgi:phytoene synthase